MIVVVAAVAATLAALQLTDDYRTVAGLVDLAHQLVNQLFAGYLDQETGMRG